MRICYVLIINRFGSLIYSQCVYNPSKVEQRTYSTKQDVCLISDAQKGTARIRSNLNGEEMLLVTPSGQSVTPETIVNEGLTVRQYMDKDEVYPVTVYTKKPPISGNHLLILASLFHSLSEVSKEIDRLQQNSGIKHIRFNDLRLCCYPSVAGLKFVVISCEWSETSERSALLKIQTFLQKVYKLYSKTIPLDPFQTADQPINSELFSAHLNRLINECETLPTSGWKI